MTLKKSKHQARKWVAPTEKIAPTKTTNSQISEGVISPNLTRPIRFPKILNFLNFGIARLVIQARSGSLTSGSEKTPGLMSMCFTYQSVLLSISPSSCSPFLTEDEKRQLQAVGNGGFNVIPRCRVKAIFYLLFVLPAALFCPNLKILALVRDDNHS